MFNTIKAFLRDLRGPSRHEREMTYLNASYDLVDLEYRQRQIDAGLFGATPGFGAIYPSMALN